MYQSINSAINAVTGMLNRPMSPSKTAVHSAPPIPPTPAPTAAPSPSSTPVQDSMRTAAIVTEIPLPKSSGISYENADAWTRSKQQAEFELAKQKAERHEAILAECDQITKERIAKEQAEIKRRQLALAAEQSKPKVVTFEQRFEARPYLEIDRYAGNIHSLTVPLFPQKEILRKIITELGLVSQVRAIGVEIAPHCVVFRNAFDKLNALAQSSIKARVGEILAANEKAANAGNYKALQEMPDVDNLLRKLQNDRTVARQTMLAAYVASYPILVEFAEEFEKVARDYVDKLDAKERQAAQLSGLDFEPSVLLKLMVGVALYARKQILQDYPPKVAINPATFLHGLALEFAK
jgi:hypothetical protein